MTTEAEATETETKDVCPECRKGFVPIASGKIRIHKIKGVKCRGSEEDPYTPESEAGDGPQCRVCKAPVQLYSNGRARSHLTRDQVPAPCDGGSDWPLGTYPDIEGPTRGDAATAGDTGWQPLPEHPHVYEYGDDDNGHSGSFCSVCGQEEPVGDPQQHRMTGSGTVKARPLGAADDFLSGPPKAPPGAADDFLSGGEDDDEVEEDGPGVWSESQYDGDCGTCGRHFDAGDRIRADGSGGWEAEDCCGDPIESNQEARTEKAEAVADKPRTAAPTLPVRNGRYVAPDPETGKPTKYTRTTTFAEAISDSIALDQWKGRMEALGLALRPDLIAKVRSAVQGAVPYEVAREQRQFLNGVVDEAKLAAGSKDRARKGTILHKHTQEIDSGRRTLAEVPDEFRPDVAAYLEAMEQAGFRLLPHLIERSVLTTELEVVGTFDRVLEVLWDQEAQDLNGRSVQLNKGDHVIGDVKSGASLEFPWLEIEIQLAIYAHAVNEHGIAVPEGSGKDVTWRWAPLSEMGVPRVRQDVGVVMHMPYGGARRELDPNDPVQASCELHLADLIEGWRGAQLCKTVRSWRKGKFPAAPFLSVVAGPSPVTEPEADQQHQDSGTYSVDDPEPTWESRFRLVQTKEQGSALWREAKAAGVPPDELKRLTGLVRLPSVVHAPAGDHADAEPLPSPELVEALHHAREADSKPDRTAVKPEDPWQIWEDRFRAVRTKQQGSAVWLQAQEAGVPPAELKRLTGLVQLPSPNGSQPAPPAPLTLEQRAAAVKDNAEASALFQELRKDADTLGKPRIAKLVGIMKDALVPF